MATNTAYIRGTIQVYDNKKHLTKNGFLDALRGHVAQFHCDLVLADTPRDIDKALPLLVLCHNWSRLGTDVDGATRELIKDFLLKTVAVLVVHEKEEHVLPVTSSADFLLDEKYDKFGLIVDFAYTAKRQIYECNLNVKGKRMLGEFIKKHVKMEIIKPKEMHTMGVTEPNKTRAMEATKLNTKHTMKSKEPTKEATETKNTHTLGAIEPKETYTKKVNDQTKTYSSTMEDKELEKTAVQIYCQNRSDRAKVLADELTRLNRHGDSVGNEYETIYSLLDWSRQSTLLAIVEDKSPILYEFVKSEEVKMRKRPTYLLVLREDDQAPELRTEDNLTRAYVSINMDAKQVSEVLKEWGTGLKIISDISVVYPSLGCSTCVD